jgi:PAS domain S-box-containing protein
MLEQAFCAAVDEAPLMLWITDSEGRVTFVNRSWLAFTGRLLAQEIGRGWMEGVHSGDREALGAELQSGIQSRAPFTLGYRLRHATGQHRWVQMHAAPRLGPDGSTGGYLVLGVEGVGRDGTASAAAHLHLQESEEQMRRLAARVQKAREEERATLARELHDELGQTLTAIKLELGRASAAISKQQLRSPVVDRLQSLIGLVEIGIATVKRITTDLRPATLDHLGLAAAIRWEAMTFRARTGLRCHIRAAKDETPLTAESQTVLFRIFQEALTNVVRHAHASAVHVTLSHKRGAFELQIRDNGRGITDARLSDPGSVGLLGMRERAALIGGTFSIAGKRGKGTTVTVRVPLVEPAAARSKGTRTERRGR